MSCFWDFEIHFFAFRFHFRFRLNSQSLRSADVSEHASDVPLLSDPLVTCLGHPCLALAGTKLLRTPMCACSNLFFEMLFRLKISSKKQTLPLEKGVVVACYRILVYLHLSCPASSNSEKLSNVGPFLTIYSQNNPIPTQYASFMMSHLRYHHAIHIIYLRYVRTRSSPSATRVSFLYGVVI